MYDIYKIRLELLNGTKTRPHTLCLHGTCSFASNVDLYNSIAIYQALSLSILIHPIYSWSGCLAMTPAGIPITLFGCSMVHKVPGMPLLQQWVVIVNINVGCIRHTITMKGIGHPYFCSCVVFSTCKYKDLASINNHYFKANYSHTDICLILHNYTVDSWACTL